MGIWHWLLLFKLPGPTVRSLRHRCPAEELAMSSHQRPKITKCVWVTTTWWEIMKMCYRLGYLYCCRDLALQVLLQGHITSPDRPDSLNNNHTPDWLKMPAQSPAPMGTAFWQLQEVGVVRVLQHPLKNNISVAQAKLSVSLLWQKKSSCIIKNQILKDTIVGIVSCWPVLFSTIFIVMESIKNKTFILKHYQFVRSYGQRLKTGHMGLYL